MCSLCIALIWIWIKLHTNGKYCYYTKQGWYNMIWYNMTLCSYCMLSVLMSYCSLLIGLKINNVRLQFPKWKCCQGDGGKTFLTKWPTRDNCLACEATTPTRLGHRCKHVVLAEPEYRHVVWKITKPIKLSVKMTPLIPQSFWSCWNTAVFSQSKQCSLQCWIGGPF